MSRCFRVEAQDSLPRLLSFDGYSSPGCVSLLATGRQYALFVTSSNELFLEKRPDGIPRKLEILQTHILQERRRRQLGQEHRCHYCPSTATAACVACDPHVPLCMVCLGSVRNHHTHETAPLDRLDPLASLSSPDSSLYMSNLSPSDQLITHISSGPFHSFVVYGSKYIFSMGLNLSGQLGLGHRNRVPNPTLLSSFPPRGYVVKDVACGRNHSVFILNHRDLFVDSDEVWVCGSGLNGQLGLGRVVLPPVGGFSLTGDGIVRQGLQEGEEREGEESSIPVLTQSSFSTPIRLHSSLLDGKRIDQTCCGDNHTLFLVSGNDASMNQPFLVGFGDCGFGELGFEFAEQRVWIPRRIHISDDDGDLSIIHIAAAGSHSIVVTETQVFATGLNTSLQTGTNESLCVRTFRPIEFDAFLSHRIMDVCCGENLSVVVVAERFLASVEQEEDESELGNDVMRLFMFGGAFGELGRNQYVRTSRAIGGLVAQKDAFYFLSD